MLVHELARLAIGELRSEIGPPLVTRFVSKRYAQLVGLTGRENSERAEGHLVHPASIATGTVVVTEDSNTVTGDATAQAAWAGKQLVGRWFRVLAGEPFYRIGSQSATTLTLEEPYQGATSATSAYEVFNRHLSLADDCRHVMGVTHDERPVQQTEVEWLDRIFPDRDELDDEPRYWAPSGEDDEGNIKIEVFPSASTSSDVVLRYTYFKHPVTFKPEDRLPKHVDAHVLEKGVMADICRWEAKALETKIRDKTEQGSMDAQMAAVWSDMAGRRLSEAQSYEREFDRLRAEGLRAARPGKGPRLMVKDYSEDGRRPIIRARDEVFRSYKG